MFNQYFSLSKPISKSPSGQSLRQCPTIPFRASQKMKTSGSHSPDKPPGQTDYFLLKQTPSPYQLSSKSPGNEVFSKGLQHNGQGASYAMGPIGPRRLSSNVEEKSQKAIGKLFERQPSAGSIQAPRSFKPNLMITKKKLEENNEKRPEEEVYDSFAESRGASNKLINQIPSMNISHDKFLSRNQTEKSMQEIKNSPNSTLNNISTPKGRSDGETIGKQVKMIQLPRKPVSNLILNAAQESKVSPRIIKGLASPKEEARKGDNSLSISQRISVDKAPTCSVSPFGCWPSRKQSTTSEFESHSKETRKKEEATRQDVLWADTEFLMNAKFNNTAKCISLLTQAPKPNLIASDNEGWTALHYAVWHNNLKFINILLLNSANPNIRTKDNVTPLMLAAKM